MDTRTFGQTPLLVEVTRNVSALSSLLYPNIHLSYLRNIFPRLAPFMLRSLKVIRGWTLEQEPYLSSPIT